MTIYVTPNDWANGRVSAERRSAEIEAYARVWSAFLDEHDGNEAAALGHLITLVMSLEVAA